MKVFCFFLLVSFACSQKLVQDRRPKPTLGPWIKGKCQRPTSGKCSKALTCCPSFTGVKIWTRSCHGIGCGEAKLVKEFECLYKCSKEASWAQWISQGCTPSCGKRQDATETFRRYCIDNKGNVVDDNFCPGASSKTVMCKQDLPRCGEWGSWTSGECSKTCGKGTHKLTRECPKNSICIGDSVKYEDCQVQECGVWSKWYADTCSASCGGGVLKSVRLCSSCSACEGDAEKVEVCNTARCGSESWSVWMKSLCSVSCGGGTRSTLRKCSVPGACEGSEEIVEECNTSVCDINECDNDSHSCDENARCENTIGSFTCTCNDGFEGDGNTCSDINECDNDSHTCDENARCENTIGSFTCTCNDGFAGDGNTCPISCGLKHGGKCYKFVSRKMNYEAAAGECRKLGSGAHLAIVKDQETFTAVKNYVRGAMSGNYIPTWIGGTYDTASYPGRRVTWVDGSSSEIPVSMWHPRYPASGSDRTHLRIAVYSPAITTSEGFYNSAPFSDVYHYSLCQVE